MDELLHQHLVVEGGGVPQGLHQRVAVSGLADAHGGAGAGGLDEHGIGKLVLQGDDHAVQVMLQVGAAHQVPGSLGDLGVVNHQLGQGLVHGHGGSGDVGTDIGNAGQLQQALDGAVLAVFAVHHGEDHIDALPDHTVVLEAEQALAPDGGNGTPAVGGIVHPGAGGQLGIVGAAEDDPVTVLGDAHGVDVVLFMVEVIQNRFGRAQGYLVLRAHAAKQNANRKFFHDDCLFHKIMYGKFDTGVYNRMQTT